MRAAIRPVIMWLLVAANLSAPPLAASPARSGVRVQGEEGMQEVRVTLEAAPVTIAERTRAGETFTFFRSTDPVLGNPGEPALPAVTRMVAIPMRSAPRLEVSLGEPQPLPRLQHPPEPIPQYRQPAGSDGSTGLEVEAYYLPAGDRYAADEWSPAQPVVASEPMTLHGKPVLQLIFRPVQVNPATGEARWFPSADVTLRWTTDELASATGSDATNECGVSPDGTPLDAGGENSLVPCEATIGLNRSTGGQGNDGWMLRLREQGVYRISLDRLAAAGVPISAPDRIAVYYGTGPSREEQAVWIDDEALYLINLREHGRWSKDIVYRLEILPSGSGKRMETVSGAPEFSTTMTSAFHEIAFERDQIYESRRSGVNPTERWYWKKLTVFSNPELNNPSFYAFEATFSLPYVDSFFPEPATVTAEIGPTVQSEGSQQQCHRVEVHINGVLAGERGNGCSGEGAWTDLSSFGQVMSVPHSSFSQSNQLRVEQAYVGGQNDFMMVNGFAVRYRRLLVAQRAEHLLFDVRGRTTGTNFLVRGHPHYLFLPTIQSRGTAQRAASEDEAAQESQEWKPGGKNLDFLAFEVSQANEPRLITGGMVSGSGFTFGRANPSDETYLVARQDELRTVLDVTFAPDSGLRSNPSQVDYIIVTPPEFAAAVDPLVAHRSSAAGGGYSVRVVTTTTIYNEFGTGVQDPAAIRAFLQYAYQNWPAPRPSYVLLVGDATYDPFNITGGGKQVWIPPMMAHRDPIIGEVPADHDFVVALDPGDSPETDPLQDMYIGRLPANSTAEVSAMVQKIINYETAAPQGEWQRRILLTTDNEPDMAGAFYTLSDNAASRFPSTVMSTRLYFRQEGSPATPLAMRDAIKSNLDAGQAIVQYIGHASEQQWAHEQIWSSARGTGENDLTLLAPNDRLPMSLPWTCLEGLFVRPNKEALSEEMLRLPDRGIIASFAPTGLDVATGHDLMTRGFFEALFDGEQVAETQLGPLVAAAKMGVAGTSFQRLMWTYVLFGDPAMHLQIKLN